MKKKKKTTISRKEYRELTGIIKEVIKNQNKIIGTIKTITAFNPTQMSEIDGDNELVKSRETTTGHYVTKKKKRKRRSHKLSITEIKAFFHGRGYEIRDDGKKPIKIFNKKGRKVFVVQRNRSIYKRDKKHPKGYRRVHIEDLA